MLPVQSAVAEHRESQVTLCDRSTISSASNRVPSKEGILFTNSRRVLRGATRVCNLSSLERTLSPV